MRSIKYLLSSLGTRNESDGGRTDAIAEQNELADTLTLVDRIRHELAASSARIFSGCLSSMDVLVEDRGVQLGLSLSSEPQAEIYADTKIYSATGSMSGLSQADLSACFSSLQQLLNATVADSAIYELQKLDSDSRTLLHAEVDDSNCAQVISIGTREPHVILGAYKAPSDHAASSASSYLGMRLQTGDPIGQRRLAPIHLESKRVRG
jgi:hypothetical protein